MVQFNTLFHGHYIHVAVMSPTDLDISVSYD